jgi:hypothetical protein
MPGGRQIRDMCHGTLSEGRPLDPDGRPRNLDCTRTGRMLGHKASVRHRKTQTVGEEAVVGWVVGRV